MSAEQTLLAGVAGALTAAGSIAKLTDGPRVLLAKLGWDLPAGVDDVGLAGLDLARVGTRLTTWSTVAGDPEASTDDQVAALADLAEAVIDALADLADLQLQAPQDYLDRTQIKDEFLTRLLDLYLIQSAAVASRPMFDVAVLLGWFELRRFEADPSVMQVAHLRHIVHWDRVPTLFTDPSGLLRETYGWGTATFDSAALVTNLGAVLQHVASDVRHRDLPAIPLSRIHGGSPPDGPPQPQLLLPLLGSGGELSGEIGLSVFGLPPTAPAATDGGIGVAPYADATTTVRIALSSTVSLGLSADADLGGGTALVLRPGTDPVLRTGLNLPDTTIGGPGANVHVDLTATTPPGQPRMTLLSATGVLVDATTLALEVTVLVDGSGADAGLQASIKGGRLSLRPEGIPFLDSVLPADGLEVDLDIDIAWSHRGGVRIGGRAELKTTLAVGRDIGPLTIDLIEIALAAGGDGLALRAGIGATVNLGPLHLSMAGMGVRAAIVPGPGALGSADLVLGMTPPDAIGISVDAAVVSGGGFLGIDPDGHTYVGVLELKVGVIAVKAIGILDTRAPGDPGWSLLLLLFAQFGEPVPLGLGFSLTGVGGIVGLNVGVAPDQLRAAMGSNAFDDVLFPADPVADAPRIVSRLRTFFPQTPGALVIGPAVEITWGGEAPLVTARLAILIQFAHALDSAPARFDRLVVLGTVSAIAPPGDLSVPPTIKLVADLLGSYDAQSGLLAIDAQLRDSVIAGVAVGGTVIVRVGLGAVPAFAVSAGGFHPDFTDLPPLLPARIDRVSLTWKAGSSADISLALQGYVALTAGTVQLGALFQLVAKIGSVSLEGMLGFDLLIAEDRSFSAHIVGRVSIKYRGHRLAGIGLDMVLSRSADHVWRVRGTATFSILWWDIDVDFDDSWGAAASLPGTTFGLADAIRTALSDPAHWTPALPRDGESLATLTSSGSGVLAHPLGQLRIAQQVAPLDLALDHLDDAQIAGPTRMSVLTVHVGPDTRQPQPTQDPFTRSRFQHLSDEQKLSARSFESMPSGVVVGSDSFTTSTGIGVGAGHETIRLGPLGVPPPPPPPPMPLPAEWLTWQLSLSAAASSPLRLRSNLRPTTDMSLGVLPQSYAAVLPGTLQVQPLDPAVTRCLPLAEQAAPGLRILESHEVG